ncbi:hypothetical protein CDD81_1469 [Ophiocordyceps australis]|uniref:Peptidase S8/S53 domain-containing protein n=1 Tax=Ophiocordyceps australis TaxID=1399860 RepID=A0A2C5YEN0_9HYPO|nr:hypothetical protein CDD81_1469 [Ophiocordyceps australis]
MEVSSTLALFWALSAANPLINKRANKIVQNDAPWGLRVISHRTPQKFPSINVFRNSKYYYDGKAGQDTVAFDIDSGILVTHKDFEGRAENLWTDFKTQMAKTTLKTRTAMAHTVKVIDQRKSSFARIVTGFHAAVKHAVKNNLQQMSVINISIAGKPSMHSLQVAIDRSFNMPNGGLVTVVAAGNTYDDASKTDPASSREAITVGSIDKSWKISFFSNWGPSVQILAPGSEIPSLSPKSDTAATIMSGTSMAAPHVAGVVLNAMSVFGQNSQSVRSFLEQTSTKDMVTGDLHGSPNRVVNNNNDRQKSCKSEDKIC